MSHFGQIIKLTWASELMGGQRGNCLVLQMCWLAASANIMHCDNVVIMFNQLVIIIIITVNDIWLMKRNDDNHTWVRLLSDPSFEANQRTWKLVMLSLCWWCCFCCCCGVIFVVFVALFAMRLLLLSYWWWGGEGGCYQMEIVKAGISSALREVDELLTSSTWSLQSVEAHTQPGGK